MTPWIRGFGPRDPATKVFCFPHAGGGIAAYNTWSNLLPDSVGVSAVQLPGRDARFGEPLLRRVEDLAEGLCEAVIGDRQLDRPYVLFGHSVGAVVAFEVAHKLRNRRAREPSELVVSGHRAPSLPSRTPPVSALPEAELIAEIQTYGGMPQAVLLSAELMALLLPVFRADFEVEETYVYHPRPPLGCPLTVFGGTDDPLTERRELEAWQDETSGPFKLQLLEGGHFFVDTGRAEIVSAIRSALVTNS